MGSTVAWLPSAPFFFVNVCGREWTVPPRKAISAEAGTHALEQWVMLRGNTPRSELATAVRFTLQVIASEYPGGAVELRVPPLGAVQFVPGTTHTRGTPPAVVEIDPQTWLELACGECDWAQAVKPGGGAVASGERSDLSPMLPVPIARRVLRGAN